MLRLLIKTALLILVVHQLKSHFVQENVIFQNLNQISLTRSEWKIACVYEIKVIIDYVDLIAKDISFLHKNVNTIYQNYRQTVAAAKIFEDDTYQLGIRDQSGFANIFKQMLVELGEISNTHKRLQLELQSYAFLSSRSRERRSLIPVIGRILSGAFGLADERQIRNLKAGIKSLSENQELIFHQLEHQMSMVNVSRKYITENRQAINKLIIGVHQVDMKLNNLTQLLADDINIVARFVQIYSQLDLSLGLIKRMINDATRYVDNLRLELSFLAIGHISPNLLSPEELSKVLFQIRSKIPSAFRLPTHPGRKLWSYFRTLNCKAIIEDNKLIVVISIPLLDADEKYQLYQVHNLAYPDPFGTPESSMTALYRLESDAFMVNTYRTEYVLLTRNELYACSQSEGHYCNAKQARMSIAKSKTCLISLFMKNTDKIGRYCFPEIYTNVQLPRAVNLEDGIYAISTKETFSLRLSCQNENENTELKIKPPLSIINLQMTCSAHNQEITLLPYFSAQATVRADNQPFFALLRESNFSEVKIWEPFLRSFPNLSDVALPDSLKTVEKIPMDSFIQNMKSYQQLSIGTSWQLPLWSKFLISGIVLFILFVIYNARQNIGLYLHKLCSQGMRKQENPEDVTIQTTTDAKIATSANVASGDSANQIKLIYPTLDLTTMKAATTSVDDGSKPEQ